MIHSLKILPKYFNAVVSGRKTFEVRHNDREFHEGDYLALNEWEQTSSVGGHYTGRSCLVYVDYILYDFEGINEDFVVMAIKPCKVFKTQEGMSESMYAPPQWNEVPILINNIKKENKDESIRTNE